MNTDRIPCSSCGSMALPNTIERFEGLCMLCYKKQYKGNPLSEDIKAPISIKKYHHALIGVHEFRELDKTLAKKIPGCDRGRWHKPFDYDTEWMNGFYEVAMPKGIPFPPGVTLLYGARTGMKLLVGLDINCCQLTKNQGRETYVDAENNSNAVMNALGLPPLMATTDGELVKTWRELLPESTGYYWKNDTVEVITAVANNLMFGIYFGKRSLKLANCYRRIEVCDMELIQRNQPKPERNNLLNEVKHADRAGIVERW